MQDQSMQEAPHRECEGLLKATQAERLRTRFANAQTSFNGAWLWSNNLLSLGTFVLPYRPTEAGLHTGYAQQSREAATSLAQRRARRLT